MTLPNNFDSIFRSNDTGILQRVSDQFKILSRPEYAYGIRHASPIMEEDDEMTAEEEEVEESVATYDDDETHRGGDFFPRGGCDDNKAYVEERGERKALLLFLSYVILFVLVPWMFYAVRVVVAHV